MSEFRQDRTTGAWVLVAPERGRRPREWRDPGVPAASAKRFDPACPFCPGNEHQLAGIIDETPSDAPPGWRTRVVPNKFPALQAGDTQEPAADGAGPAVAGHGFHEVIIETGRHDADLATLPENDVVAVLQSYRRRYVELMARPSVKAVLVFRNHGARAGASLVHPHSQVIATPIVPPRHLATAVWARSSYGRLGRCPACAELETETADGRRVVEATEHFLAAVPFAAASPFEQRIFPRTHQPSFAACDDGALLDFGRLLQRVLRRLKRALDDPPYNFVIESGNGDETDAAYMHWWLRIVPDLVTPGGFELGAGLPINPSLPETDAETLRAGDPAAMEETP